MDASLAPVSEILKLLKEVKKVMSYFPLVFKRLASTLERIVPIITEIEKLQKRSNPSSQDLDFLTETTRRAKEVVRECPRIQGYNILKKKRYIKEIEEINQKFLTFCQVELSLIGLRDSLSRRSLEETTSISTGRRSSFDEDEQRIILESIKDNVKNEDEDEERAVLESIKDNLKDEDGQRVILESIKDNLKDEDDQRVILESIKANEKNEDEQRAILESIKADNLKDEDDQRVILESIKANEKRKQVQADEQFALCLNMELLHAHQKIDSPCHEFNFLSHQQVAERQALERLTNGASSSTTTLANEDEQRAILESIKKNEA